jgi:hypothetical protein
LELYCSRLAHYGIDDIRAAIEKLMFTRREEGETAFPDLPTLDEYIRAAKNARLRTEREQRERAEAEAEERDRHEHPENYFDVRQMIHEFVKSNGIEVLPPQKPVSLEGVTAALEVLTAADLRALADVVEKREGMKRRERRV